ncbi:hypothetical protein [Nocardiopsis rhodophaea]|uniref:hypothetical protein n=1 Tax=Nocardiopsis rhodophaea TaxID=280238 RepID=UPI0031D59B43
MDIAKKTAAVAVGLATLVAGGVAAASPAAAASRWITSDEVWTINNPRTALSVNTSVGTVQVRYGTYRGRQYGWGRALNSYGGYKLRFEVDTDGDRIPNNESSLRYIKGPGATWTSGYQTSSSSARAFRACIMGHGQHRCSQTSNRTGWW